MSNIYKVIKVNDYSYGLDLVNSARKSKAIDVDVMSDDNVIVSCYESGNTTLLSFKGVLCHSVVYTITPLRHSVVLVVFKEYNGKVRLFRKTLSIGDGKVSVTSELLTLTEEKMWAEIDRLNNMCVSKALREFRHYDIQVNKNTIINSLFLY